ncbi:uncharacterized protein [Leuresthes tenuis]|uniref:uncharacterized protein n=1 Tax=Leuresthes tenuis TaxID=355514 RepID=UPI003B502BAE
MLLYLLLAAHFCHISGILQQTVMLHSVAALPCPHATGDVSWSRLKENGEKMLLVSIINGQESRTDTRYGSQADGALLINKVEESDERMYLCNTRKTVYLRVTTDPREVSVPAESGRNGFKPEQTGGAADIQRSPDWWKVPAGVVAGASLTLLSILALKLCSKRAKRVHSSSTVPDTVYEEIQEPSAHFGAESPYYSTITGTPPSSTAADLQPYSAVSRPQAEARSDRAGVHSLVQPPGSTAGLYSLVQPPGSTAGLYSLVQPPGGTAGLYSLVQPPGGTAGLYSLVQPPGGTAGLYSLVQPPGGTAGLHSLVQPPGSTAGLYSLVQPPGEEKIQIISARGSEQDLELDLDLDLELDPSP